MIMPGEDYGTLHNYFYSISWQVIQMVSLMDRLLKLENLDLHLTPYHVLATGQDEGMLEFIPSSSLAQVPTFFSKFHHTIYFSTPHMHSSSCIDIIREPQYHSLPAEVPP
jgi:hypothetical protein